MANLSIRKLPTELEKAIQREARKRKTTKTEVVIDALTEVFHPGKSSAGVHRDVRGFFGKMTRQDYQRFQKLTRDFSAIDVELWK